MANLIPAEHALKIWKQGYFARTFKFRNAGVAVDLSGPSSSAAAYMMRPGGSQRWDLVATISDGADGAVTITPVQSSLTIGAGFRWELVVTLDGVRQQPWVIGPSEVVESIVP